MPCLPLPDAGQRHVRTGLDLHNTEQRQLHDCPDCGQLQSVPPLPPNASARCLRCHRVLRTSRRDPLRRPLACAVAGLCLYVSFLTLQFMDIEVLGRNHATSLLDFPKELAGNGYWELAALFVLFIIILPPLKLAVLAFVLLGLRCSRRPEGLATIFRWHAVLAPWAMVEVFMVGFFVAYTRLVGLATVEVGAGIWGMAGLMLASAAADFALDRTVIWQALHPQPAVPADAGLLAHRALTGCPRCGRLCGVTDGQGHRCPRCGVRVWVRKPASLRRTWAFLLAAAICAVGAYALPIMTVTRLGQGEPTTIFAGLIELAALGWWPIVIIVFVASITIPLFKLTALAYLAISVQFGFTRRLGARTVIYRFVEVIGRWSMIDIFMVSILTASVQLGFLGTVRPEPGAVAFAAVVILTMFAAYSFDPRLMWDAAERAKASADPATGKRRRRLAARTRLAAVAQPSLPAA